MKLMYSIIIVVIAIVAVTLLLKKNPQNVAYETGSSATNNYMNNEENTSQTVASTVNPSPGETKPSDEELKMTIVKQGSGEAVSKDGDVLAVHYTGYLLDGTKFDSSVDRGTPFVFNLGAGEVIAGWEIGMKGMKVGESRKLTIPGKFAYGERGFPGVIPPNATLVFDVELIAINPKTDQ
jgi:FKBP-type peptidyl-prolyl cis-trans isomerase